MWLAVKQLLPGAPAADRFRQVTQCPVKHCPVVVAEGGRAIAACNQPLGLRDAVREVRRRDVDGSQRGMQPLERIREVAGEARIEGSVGSRSRT